MNSRQYKRKKTLSQPIILPVWMFYAVTPINPIWPNPCNHHPSRRINCISQEFSTSNFSMSNSQLSSLPLAQLYSLADDTTSSGCLVMRHLHVQEYPTR